jgi:predicted naringenin-chalcone synthase
MNNYLGNFHVIRPDFEFEQSKALEWIAAAHAQVKGNASSKFVHQQLERVGKGLSAIKKRGVHLDDFFHMNWEKMNIYTLSENMRGKGLEQRNQWYEAAVAAIFERFYPEATPLPAHLFHVTCTGYTAPSGAQKIVGKRKASTTVLHLYHMGCCAALPAMRIGRRQVDDVDIVHTEICSLHLDALSFELAQIIIQNLFADGFIKYTLSQQEKEFKIVAVHEEILPDTPDCITWKCADWGFVMTLAKEVPQRIRSALDRFLTKLADQVDLSIDILTQEAFFAIHPGGPKIVEQISLQLTLQPWQTAHSREVIQNYGNMSSATLPHIWEKMTDASVPKNALIVSLAFGPGLTICGCILKKIKGAT